MPTKRLTDLQEYMLREHGVNPALVTDQSRARALAAALVDKAAREAENPGRRGRTSDVIRPQSEIMKEVLAASQWIRTPETQPARTTAMTIHHADRAASMTGGRRASDMGPS